MKGLMKNNFYAVLANAKVFSIFMIIIYLDDYLNI